ncbi:unnamed protein product [Peniophora sp. CBMAI 1063]|nr:unnamed protein product [Peniophora sp. CBMAI 1063]
MPLWKVPCLLAVWGSYMVVSTPPPVAAPPETQRPYEELSWAAKLLQKRDAGRMIVNSLVTYVMFAEAAFTTGIAGYGPIDEAPNSDKNMRSRDRSNANTVSPVFLAGVMCSLLGGILRYWSYEAMGRHFTFQLSILEEHQLITDGPYAYVRHPGYTALILTFFGISACELSPGSWWIEAHIFDSICGKFMGLLGICAVLQLVMVVSRAPAEDRALREKFGSRWDEWARRVPYRYIPGVC